MPGSVLGTWDVIGDIERQSLDAVDVIVYWEQPTRLPVVVLPCEKCRSEGDTVPCSRGQLSSS